VLSIRDLFQAVQDSVLEPPPTENTPPNYKTLRTRDKTIGPASIRQYEVEEVVGTTNKEFDRNLHIKAKGFFYNHYNDVLCIYKDVLGLKDLFWANVQQCDCTVKALDGLESVWNKKFQTQEKTIALCKKALAKRHGLRSSSSKNEEPLDSSADGSATTAGELAVVSSAVRAAGAGEPPASIPDTSPEDDSCIADCQQQTSKKKKPMKKNFCVPSIKPKKRQQLPDDSSADGSATTAGELSVVSSAAAVRAIGAVAPPALIPDTSPEDDSCIADISCVRKNFFCIIISYFFFKFCELIYIIRQVEMPMLSQEDRDTLYCPMGGAAAAAAAHVEAAVGGGSGAAEGSASSAATNNPSDVVREATRKF